MTRQQPVFGKIANTAHAVCMLLVLQQLLAFTPFQRCLGFIDCRAAADRQIASAEVDRACESSTFSDQRRKQLRRLLLHIIITVVVVPLAV
jgi:hypothetical protein